MARLLVYTAPATGHMYPATTFCLELHRRGHEVHVRTRRPDVDRLNRLGIHAAPVDPRIEANELDDWKASNPIAALQRLATLVRGQREGRGRRPTQRDRGRKPDALIVDANFQGGAAMAEASGLPWCQYSPFPPVFGPRTHRPTGRGSSPPRGPAGPGARPRPHRRCLGRAGRPLPTAR